MFNAYFYDDVSYPCERILDAVGWIYPMLADIDAALEDLRGFDGDCFITYRCGATYHTLGVSLVFYIADLFGAIGDRGLRRIDDPAIKLALDNMLKWAFLAIANENYLYT